MIDDTELDRDLMRENLFYFVWEVCQLLNPSKEFIPNWHVRAICHQLERVARGECTRLLITIPPRHLKSISTAVAFVAWLLGRDPALRIMVASYGHDLAGNHARDCRTVMESDFYRALFPKTRLFHARELELGTNLGGGRKAVSRSGSATGFGADVIIVDDLMKAGDANSPAEREAAKECFEQTLVSRLNDKRNGIIIVIQQRLHEDDLANHVLEKGTFEHLNLRAIAEDDEAHVIGRDPLTGEDALHHRARGEALFPQMESLEVLERTRREMGNMAFSAQYQQNPTAPGGNRIQLQYFGAHEKGEADRDWFQCVVQSWDTALSEEETSDYSVGTTWGYREGDWYLLDVARERLNFSALKRRVVGLKRRWRADRVIIERAGTGLSLLHELRQEEEDGWIYTWLTPKLDKLTRLEVEAAKLETGRFLLPRRAEWLDAFRRELQAFPNGRYDDQVDSMTQFLRWTGLPRAALHIETAQNGGRRQRRRLHRRR
jgi:predicted phage terminase large subunit-like protein